MHGNGDGWRNGDAMATRMDSATVMQLQCKAQCQCNGDIVMAMERTTAMDNAMMTVFMDSAIVVGMEGTTARNGNTDNGLHEGNTAAKEGKRQQSTSTGSGKGVRRHNGDANGWHNGGGNGWHNSNALARMMDGATATHW